MKAGCWAADLGDCEGKLSGEHLVSASLWTGPVVMASGGPWGEPRKIGISSLTAKILCQHHNSRLSEVDVAGSQAFATFTKETVLTNGRQLIPVREWMIHCFSIDGPGLERWFIKTTINIANALRGGHPHWAYDGTVGRPPLPLVRAVFGLGPVIRPLGLYAAASVGDDVNSTEEVRCELLFDAQDRIAGASYIFRGFRTVINMTMVQIAGILSRDDQRVIRSREELLYHVKRINSNVGQFRSHFLDLNWPEINFAHFALE